MSDRERFTFVLECPRYGCETVVATTSTIAGPFEAPPKCYCPNHDDWVEMTADPVEVES